jgi:hypothetical protein
MSIITVFVLVILVIMSYFDTRTYKEMIKEIRKLREDLNKEAKRTADAIKQELESGKFWSDQLHAEVGYGRKSVKEEEDDSIVILTKERDHRIIDSLDKERGY